MLLVASADEEAEEEIIENDKGPKEQTESESDNESSNHEQNCQPEAEKQHGKPVQKSGVIMSEDDDNENQV